MGYSVSDPELRKFLAERHDDDPRAVHVGYGRPVNEVFGALKNLTGQDFDHMELAFVGMKSYDTPRQTRLKRQLFEKSARRWAAWWEANWSQYTNERRFSKVGLPIRSGEASGSGQEVVIDESIDRFSQRSFQGFTMQPVCSSSERLCFLDLDTNRWAVLPSFFNGLDEPVATLPIDIRDWAKQEGFDLYGATIQVNGESHYVIKSIDTQVFEVVNNDEKRSWTVEFAKRLGRPTDDTIVAWDKELDKPRLESTGDFIFITKENTVGFIALGVEVKSRDLSAEATRGDRNLQTSGRYLGRRMGLSYLVPHD